jgi:hypothetical protein
LSFCITDWADCFFCHRKYLCKKIKRKTLNLSN